MIDDSTICTYQKELSQKNHVPGAPHSKVVYRSVEASRRCIGGCVKVSLHAIIRSNATMSRNGPADESGPESRELGASFAPTEHLLKPLRLRYQSKTYVFSG